jgi:hypothetical protein
VAPTCTPAPCVSPPAGFIYTDSVTISGEINDASGIAASSPTWLLSGIGGSPSTAQAITCTGMPAKCAFTITPVSLRALSFLAGTGNMTLTIAADDLAVRSDGTTPAPHHGTRTLNVPVTRLKWSTQLAALASVKGLAVHPNGDVIVTGNGATATSNTVMALNPDGSPFWQKGNGWYSANSHLGNIDGAPSVGTGSSTTALIYVATTRRDFVAINPTDGSLAWQCGVNAMVSIPHQPPAVVQTLGTGSCEAAIVASDNHHLYAACRNGTTATCTQLAGWDTSANPNCGCRTTSPAVNVGSKIFLGFDLAQGMSSTALLTTGPGLSTTSTVLIPNNSGTITNLSTDGTQLYAVDGAASQMYGVTQTPAVVWNVATSAAVNGSSVIEPSSGGVIVNTNDRKLQSLAQSNGAATSLRTFASGNGNAPLLGSNGYMYFGNDAGAMLAVQDTAGYATAWSYSPGATAISVAPNMDCSGILYFAAGNTIYALITDSTSGMRQGSPWPKYQRDSRNSGNADATTLWGAQPATGSCVQ